MKSRANFTFPHPHFLITTQLSHQPQEDYFTSQKLFVQNAVFGMQFSKKNPLISIHILLSI